MRRRASRIVHRIRSWPRHVLITLAVVVAVLLAARIALPFVVRSALNHRLEKIPGYTGHVNDVSMHLWRGAYSMQGLRILRREGQVTEPFFLAKNIDFSIAWRELFRRKFVSAIFIEQGQLNIVTGPTPESSQTDLDRRWQDVIQDIFPIDITHLEIADGLLRYTDTTKEPGVDVFVRNMRARATGLRNRSGEGDGETMPAAITLEGDSLGGGKLSLVLGIEPLADEPRFHLSLKLDDVNLPDLNDALKSYANVDVGRGTFRLAMEMAASDGGFQGYVKPFFEDLDFKNLEDENKGIGTRLWEKIVASLAWVVKNKGRDQVATRIPFEGKFGDAKVGLLATIANLFHHGFIRAFNPTIEGSLGAKKVGPPASRQEAAAQPPK